MKIIYETPEIEIVSWTDADVITTSGCPPDAATCSHEGPPVGPCLWD